MALVRTGRWRRSALFNSLRGQPHSSTLDAMAISESTWRSHPLIVGFAYKAIENFFALPESEFKAGHLYQLQHIGHSHYDSSTVFQFRSLESNALRYWWWYDDDPDELCTRHFEQCP